MTLPLSAPLTSVSSLHIGVSGTLGDNLDPRDPKCRESSQASKVFSSKAANVAWFIPTLRKLSTHLVRSARNVSIRIFQIFLEL